LLQRGHRKKPHHTPLDTINRLFQKHLKGMPAIADNAPRLTSQKYARHPRDSFKAGVRQVGQSGRGRSRLRASDRNHQISRG
jgi:hypothetical protein